MITRLLSTLVSLAWALWLGGMVMLFAGLGAVFTTPGYANDVRGAFAQRLFPVFERMQLILATVALLGTAGWWLARRARVKMLLFGLFAAATVVAVFETTSVTPRVQRLVEDGRRGTPEFDRAHALSTRVYMSGAVVLLVAGLALPGAIRSDVRDVRDREDAGTPLAGPQAGAGAKES